MANVLKLEGIVLRKKSLLNKDFLVTIFSKELGKIKVFAKGAKKITSKRLSHLQTGNLIEILINKKADRLYLQETKLISAFSTIKNSQEKSNYLYYFLFIIDRILPENQKDLPVYRLLIKYFIDLAKSRSFTKDTMNRYIKSLLINLGYIDKTKNKEDMSATVEEIINEKLPTFII